MSSFKALCARAMLFAALTCICIAGQRPRPAAAVPNKYTFVGNSIPDGSSITPVQTVSGLTGTITHLRVRLLGLTHPDLGQLLVQVSNSTVGGRTLFGPGGGSANGVNLTFDVNAPSVPPSSPPTGTYQPTSGPGNFESFLGQSPNGQWSFLIQDSNADGVTGSYTGLELYITTTTTVDLAPTVGAVTSSSPIAEGDTLTGSGSFTDSDSTLFLGTVDYGDGSVILPLTVNSGAKTFSLSHQYLSRAGSPFHGTVTVFDDDGKSGTHTFDVAVNSISPSALLVSLGNTVPNEGGSVSLEGSFADTDDTEPHTVTFHWNDGGPDTTLNLAANDYVIPTTRHTYVDNLPGNAFRYLVVTVSDGSSTPAIQNFPVTVRNVAPTTPTANLQNSTINENGTASLSGAFTDPGTEDTHTVTINWGDGGGNTTLNLGANVLTYDSPHQYLDNGAFTITVHVSDKDGANAADRTTSVTVNNVAPGNPTANLQNGTINENDSASLSGSFTDPGTADTHTVTINWGDGGGNSTLNLAANVLTYNTTHQYLDNKPGNAPYGITVHVTDDDGGANAVDGTASLTVNNVAPSSVTLTGSGTVSEQGTASFNLSFADPGTLDTHHVVINWGDPLNATDTTFDLGAGVLTSNGITHQYPDDAATGTPSDTYTITATVTDKDSAQGGTTRAITVQDLAPVVAVTGGLNTVSGQYSDPLPNREITATDNPLDPNPTATTCWGPQGGSLAPGLPANLALTLTQPTDGSGVTKWVLSGTPVIAPGTYTIRVKVTDEDTVSGSVDLTLTVTPEDARTTYTGPYIVSALTGATSAVVPLKVTVKDITAVPADPAYDSYAGEIKYATVTFYNRGGGALSPPIPVVPSPTDPTTGTASYNLTVSLGSGANTSLELATVVGGYYTRNSTAEDVYITVQQPKNTTGTIAAAGSYVSVSSGGALAAQEGSTPYFGITGSSAGGPPQGGAFVLYRPAGTGSTYIIAVNTYTTATIPVGGATAHLTGAASIYDITSGTASLVTTGTATLDLVDRKGNGTDTLALSVSNGGTLLFSSRLQGGATVQTPVKSPARINLYYRP